MIHTLPQIPFERMTVGLAPTDTITQNPPHLVCVFPAHCRPQRLSQTHRLRSRYGTSQILMPSEVCFHGNLSHASIPLRWDRPNTLKKKKEKKNTVEPPRCINMKREAAPAKVKSTRRHVAVAKLNRAVCVINLRVTHSAQEHKIKTKLFK